MKTTNLNLSIQNSSISFHIKLKSEIKRSDKQHVSSDV